MINITHKTNDNRNCANCLHCTIEYTKSHNGRSYSFQLTCHVYSSVQWNNRLEPIIGTEYPPGDTVCGDYKIKEWFCPVCNPLKQEDEQS
jgi:hypothetical protein